MCQLRGGGSTGHKTCISSTLFEDSGGIVSLSLSRLQHDKSNVLVGLLTDFALTTKC